MFWCPPMAVLAMVHFCAEDKRGNSLKTIAPGDTRSNEDALPPPITVYSPARIRPGSAHPAEKGLLFNALCLVTLSRQYPMRVSLTCLLVLLFPGGLSGSAAQTPESDNHWRSYRAAA